MRDCDSPRLHNTNYIKGCTAIFGCAAPLIVMKQHFFVMNLVRLYRLWINPIRGLKPSQIEELILSCKQGTEQFNITQTSIAHLYSLDTFRLRQHFSFWTLILYKATWIAHRVQSPFGNFNPVFQIFISNERISSQERLILRCIKSVILLFPSLQIIFLNLLFWPCSAFLGHAFCRAVIQVNFLYTCESQVEK